MIYDIATEPCNEQYCSFVDYAITHSDAVMLVFSIKKGVNFKVMLCEQSENNLHNGESSQDTMLNGRLQQRMIQREAIL